MVRQFQNEYNPIHWHTGHISGAGWLKVPKSFGNAKKNKSNNPNGKLNFIHGLNFKIIINLIKNIIIFTFSYPILF